MFEVLQREKLWLYGQVCLWVFCLIRYGFCLYFCIYWEAPLPAAVRTRTITFLLADRCCWEEEHCQWSICISLHFYKAIDLLYTLIYVFYLMAVGCSCNCVFNSVLTCWLGGGFKYFVFLTPQNLGEWSNLADIFSDGLVQPPPSWCMFSPPTSIAFTCWGEMSHARVSAWDLVLSWVFLVIWGTWEMIDPNTKGTRHSNHPKCLNGEPCHKGIIFNPFLESKPIWEVC